MQVYLVGGAVRDELLGRAVRERDWVVVGAVPADLERLGYRAVGREFPVFLHPETQEEYALARLERKVAPGYRGFVTEHSPAVTLEEDLLRRDLTVNAMARSADGHIIDPYGGRADLQARVLRHVSPAFAEDPVRILRVARFAARFADLGFTVAPETMALMRAMVANGETHALVSERVWRELEGALGTASPQRCFEVLRDCGALPVLLPELANSARRAAGHAGAPGGGSRRLGKSGPLGIAAGRTARCRRRIAVCTLAGAERTARTGGAGGTSGRGSQRAGLNTAVADPQLLLSLFEQADAFRRPERFAQWLEVLAARRSAAGRAGRGNRGVAHAPAQRAGGSGGRAAERRGAARPHRGPQIGALLRERRLAALRSARG